MADCVKGPGGFTILDQERKKKRVDFWEQLCQKFNVKDEDVDAYFPIEIVPFVAERSSGRVRKAEATFKTRRANGVSKKKKINTQLLPHKSDKLKNVGNVKLGKTGILNPQSSRKAGGKVNTNRNVNIDSSKVKVAQEQDLPSTAILKTETIIGINRKLKNVDNVNLGTTGILNPQSSRKAGGKVNTTRNVNSNSSQVKVAQEQDLPNTAILKTETNIGINRKSKRIRKRRTFTLYEVAVVPRKRRTHTTLQKKMKRDPDNLNSQRLVVNIFSKEFNMLLATKYKDCLSKVVSSKRDLEECCKKLRGDLNASAGAAKDISLNRLQSKKETTRTNLTATCCISTRRRPEINKTNCNINTTDLDSKEFKDTKTSIALCKELELPRLDISIKSELLDEIESKNIEVSQDDISLSQSCLWQSFKKENDVKCEYQQIEGEFDCEHLSLGDSSSRSLTTNLKLEASHKDLGQKLKCEVQDVDLIRKCTPGKKLEDSLGDLPRKLKCEVEDVDSSKKRTRSKTLTTKLKLEASHKDLGQKVNCEVQDVDLSRKCTRGKKLEASHEDLARKLKCEVKDVDSSRKRTRSKTRLNLEASQDDLHPNLKCELNDVGPGSKRTQGKRAKKICVKPELLVEDVPQNKRESLRRHVCKIQCRWCVNCALETTPKIKCEPGLQTVTSRRICANNKTEAQIILEKREMHNSTVPVINAKVKSENESRKTQSLNVFSSDTSTNTRWCLRNRTVFESNEINEQLEAKVLIEEKLKSDLGNMVFQRFCYLNLPGDGDKALLEFWNEEVKRELQRLRQAVSFKKLSLYMKLALADRLSQSLNGSGKSECINNEQGV